MTIPHMLRSFLCLASLLPITGAELDLLNPPRGLNPSRFTPQDAELQFKSDQVRIHTGISNRWPGLAILAPGGSWDLSQYAHVAISLENFGTNSFKVAARIDNAGADGVKNCVTESVSLPPRGKAVLKVLLKRESGDTLEGKLFAMRGYPVRIGGPGTIDPGKVTQILLFLNQPAYPENFALTAIKAGGAYTKPTANIADADPFFPLIDTFGQYKHRDWPGKVHSLSDLREGRDTEAKQLSGRQEPAGWDEYGGWASGPLLRATGFFRTQLRQGKWWLIDPAGRLFFSHGIDCVRALDTTPIAERATWFEDFPGNQFPQFLSTGFALKGHYAGNSVQCFSFAGANLVRKYGPDWKREYSEVIHRRLRSWGLNTIANWSDEATFLMRRTPYTDALSTRGAKQIGGSDGYWGKFPDVFDPSFQSSLQRNMAAKRGKSADDPWCIGYFSDNEMSWGDDVSLAIAALKSAPEQAAKKVFLSDLENKYGSIQKLNEAWGASHPSWAALLEARQAPDPKRARADLNAFYTKAAEAYFRTVRDVIKAAAPNQLYLGCRFAWVNPSAALAAGKYCDVVSYNLYQRNIAEFHSPVADKPLLVGEFHFGALDRGMFHTGLVSVSNQAERAETYRQYVLGALKHPQFVGVHWFQWKDEPVTGRVYDEENYQIGFVDVADTPYPEMIGASREAAASLYLKK